MCLVHDPIIWLIYIFTRVLRHLYMVISEVVTLFLYAISIAFLPEYFGAFPLVAPLLRLT